MNKAHTIHVVAILLMGWAFAAVLNAVMTTNTTVRNGAVIYFRTGPGSKIAMAISTNISTGNMIARFTTHHGCRWATVTADAIGRYLIMVHSNRCCP